MSARLGNVSRLKYPGGSRTKVANEVFHHLWCEQSAFSPNAPRKSQKKPKEVYHPALSSTPPHMMYVDVIPCFPSRLQVSDLDPIPPTLSYSLEAKFPDNVSERDKNKLPSTDDVDTVSRYLVQMEGLEETSMQNPDRCFQTPHLSQRPSTFTARTEHRIISVRASLKNKNGRRVQTHHVRGS